MRRLLILISTLILLTAIPALGQVSSESGSRIEVEPETSTNVQSIPIDAESGMVDWDSYLALPEGIGATFGFIQVLYPPDPSALANSPDMLLDGAWYPPIPFSSGMYPSMEPQAATVGFQYIEDSSGYLARRDMSITDSSGSWVASTWYLGGVYVYHIEEGWAEGVYSEGLYLPDEWSGPGIDYFLRTVWFKGVLEGEMMQRLLTLCGATPIGRDRQEGGRDRLMIYEIPANEIDRQNGRGSLLIWVMQGSWRLERSRLHSVYAIEITQYENLQSNIELDPIVFESQYLLPELYWSIDEYLLTHNNPFLDVPSNLVYENPETDGAGEVEASDAVTDDETSEENVEEETEAVETTEEN